jgi:NADH dehydrogenase
VIAVAGSTGFVGRHLVRRLASLGLRVRGLARNPAAARALFPSSVEIVQADLLQPDTLGPALSGVEVLVHCAAITADHKEASRREYARVNGEGTRNLVAACRAAHTRKIVLLNGLGTKRGADGSYMRTRWDMAEAVRTSGLPWVSPQPSILFGDGAPFPAAIAKLARTSPVMPILGSGRTKLQPLWVEDLCTCLALCVQQSTWDGRAMDLGGPEQLPYTEVVRLILAAAHLRRPMVPVPLPLARIAAQAMSVLPSPPLVPATLELFDFDNATDLDSVQKIFGFAPRSMRAHLQEHGLDG